MTNLYSKTVLSVSSEELILGFQCVVTVQAAGCIVSSASDFPGQKSAVKHVLVTVIHLNVLLMFWQHSDHLSFQSPDESELLLLLACFQPSDPHLLMFQAETSADVSGICPEHGFVVWFSTGCHVVIDRFFMWL